MKLLPSAGIRVCREGGVVGVTAGFFHGRLKRRYICICRRYMYLRFHQIVVINPSLYVTELGVLRLRRYNVSVEDTCVSEFRENPQEAAVTPTTPPSLHTLSSMIVIFCVGEPSAPRTGIELGDFRELSLSPVTGTGTAVGVGTVRF